MKSSYKTLGEHIRIVDIRNTEDKKDNLLGVSVSKVFIKSIANTVGTDFTSYRVVKKNQFTYIPDTSRRGDKIGIALLDTEEEGLVSQAYTVFEIIDKERLLPEYLMMWFRRPEFDRYARFISHGSVREIFEWQDMCNIELPIPHIEKQREIVKEYNVLVNRIALNNQLIQRLEEAAQAIYKHWFVDFEFPDESGKLYRSSGGMMEFNEELEREIPKGWELKRVGDLCDIKGGKRLPQGEILNDEKNGNPYIKIADMCTSKYIVINDKFQYINDTVQKKISKYIVSKGDLILSIVGSIGFLNIIHETLNGANLTENCVRLTNLITINSDYLYHFLFSSVGQQIIETKTVGGVQGKLPIYNIQSIPIICPNQSLLEKFEKLMRGINSSLEVLALRNAKLNLMVEIIFAKLSK